MDKLTRKIANVLPSFPLDIISIVPNYTREYLFLKAKVLRGGIIKKYRNKLSYDRTCELAVKGISNHRLSSFENEYQYEKYKEDARKYDLLLKRDSEYPGCQTVILSHIPERHQDDYHCCWARKDSGLIKMNECGCLTEEETKENTFYNLWESMWDDINKDYQDAKNGKGENTRQWWNDD
jgi:hypothetical protein